MAEDLAPAPELRVAIVTCIDCRLDVFTAFGLRRGQTHVIRHAGGVITDDVVRSLRISQRMLGTREIATIRHTRCGMLTCCGEPVDVLCSRDPDLLSYLQRRPASSCDTATGTSA